MNDFIRGYRDEEGLFVSVNGETVQLAPSLRVINHSPSGFECGYGGSGPAQLALAILLMYGDKKTATALHQDFKWEFLAKPEYFGVDSFEIEIDIPAWIENKLKGGAS